MDEETRNKKRIDKIIRDTNKDTSYKHAKEMMRLKDKMAKDQGFKQEMIRDLGIPKFDRDEQVNADLDYDDEEYKKLEQDRERRRQGKEKHDLFQQMIENAQGKIATPKKMKAGRKFRVYTKAIYEFITILRNLRNKEVNKRKENINNFKESLTLYVDVAKNWILGCIKVPVTGLLQDQTFSINFVDAFTNPKIESCFRKAKVRVESIIDSIVLAGNEREFPFSLLLFLNELTSEGTFIPNNFFTIFELHRAILTKYGALKAPSDEVKQMIIAFFLLGKILCGLIFLQPETIGLVEINKTCKENFQILASIIWHACLKYLKTYVKCIDPKNDSDFVTKNGKKYRKKPTDIISEDLYDERDLSHLFVREVKWFNVLAVKCGKFLRKLVEMCPRHQEIKRLQEKG